MFAVLSFFRLSTICYSVPVPYRSGFQQPLHAYVQVCIALGIREIVCELPLLAPLPQDLQVTNLLQVMSAVSYGCITTIQYVDLSYSIPSLIVRAEDAVFRLRWQ